MQLKLEMEQQTQQLEKERELEDHAARAAKEAEVSKASRPTGATRIPLVDSPRFCAL